VTGKNYPCRRRSGSRRAGRRPLARALGLAAPVQPARYSGLPGAGFPAPAFHYPTKDETAPLGRVRPRDYAAAGIERVPRTVGVRDGRPLLEDGRVLEVAVDRRPSQLMRRLGARERLVLGWSGMRGAVSLAAALALPLELPGPTGPATTPVQRLHGLYEFRPAPSQGVISHDVMHRIERELDLEATRLVI
jgi:hypothetical protein